MDSMTGKSHDIPSHMFPPTKIKNVCCVKCKHCFVVKDFSHLRGVRVPFILECGHPICYGCIETNPLKYCPKCERILPLDEHQNVSCSVNAYALGLIFAVNKRSLHAQEPDVSFQHSLNSRPKQVYRQAHCNECGLYATVQCPQCDVLLCGPCYSKIHGKALEHHKRICLSDTKFPNLVTFNVCSETCNKSPGYYCEDCKVSRCSDCMLRSHKDHSHKSLQEKNEKLTPDFCTEYEKVAECFQRVQQALKKLRTIPAFPAELQNSEAVETAVSQHFAYLHGVLQNTERKLIEEIRRQRDRVGQRLEEIGTQLRAHGDELQATLIMAAAVKENSNNVDMEEVIRKLKEVADLPCHLVQEPVSKDDKIEIQIDRSIAEAIENHCTIQTPVISVLNLKPTSLLPEDYEMEPLTEEIKIPKFKNSTSTPPAKPEELTLSLISPKPEIVPGVLTQDTGTCVRVTNVVDPLCFYVQHMHKVSQFEELKKMLAEYGNAPTSTVPTEVLQNRLYVILRKRDKQWCRGRITKIITDANNQERYSVFYVDDGTRDNLVPAKYMRDVTLEISTPPMMAIKCSLHNIAPRDGKWKRTAIKAFCELVKEQDEDTLNVSVTMHVAAVRGNVHYVDLFVLRPDESGGPKSIRDTLIVKGLASFHSWDNMMRMNPQSMQTFYTEKLELDKFVNVDVQHVVSAEEIYVTKTDNKYYLKKMLKDMAENYGKATEDEELVFAPQKNMPCAVENADGGWYRAIITDVDTYGGTKVFLVDVGTSLTRQQTELRVLTSKYLVTPTQAIKISLRNVQSFPTDCGNWNNITQFLKGQLKGKPNVKIVPFEKIGNSYSCHLYLKDDLEFSTVVFSGSPAESIETGSKRYSSCPLPSLPPAPQRVKKNEDTKVYKKKAHQQKKAFSSKSYTPMGSMDPLSTSKDEQDPFKIRVHVHQIISPDCIYVSEVSREDSNVDMKEAMQEFYNKYRSKVLTVWEENQVYAVYSAKDKSYFRARILTLKSANEALVFFYDLGIEEVVTLKNIQTLHEKFLQIPAYLFKVRLAGILPCGGSTTWPSLSCESLKDIVNNNQNCKFYISKAEETNNDAIPVELWVKQSKTEGPLAPTKVEINCINRMLVENGVALPIKGYAQRKDKILAIDLKRELNESSTPVDPKAVVTWFSVDDVSTEFDSEYQHTIEAESETSSSELPKSESDLSEYLEPLQSPPRSFKWKPAEPIIENEFKAIPTYVDHDCAVYLHSIEQNGETLQLIESKLHDLYKNQKLRTCDMAWQPGDVCIAQYHHNKRWYRAKVIELLKNDTVQVEFVDYGNVEECEIGTLLKRVILRDIPIQCTKCIIHGLYPNTADRKWSVEDLDIIHAILVEKECKITVLERKSTHLVVSITLFEPKDCDLVTYLINVMKMNLKFGVCDINNTVTHVEENSTSLSEKCITQQKGNDDDRSETLTCLDLSEDSPNPDDAISRSDSVQIHKHNIDGSDTATTDLDNLSWVDLPGISNIVSSTPFNETMENLSPHYVHIKLPDVEDTLEVEICFIHRPTMYYIHLRDSDETTTLGSIFKRYEQMMDRMQKGAEAQPLIETLTPNTTCCAKFQDGLWYRCLIKECITNPKTDNLEITLSYVDFGNKEERTVDRKDHNLRVLKEEWLSIPVMAIKCCLWNVEVLCDIENYNVLVPTLEQFYGMLLIAKIKKIQENVLWADLFTDKSCTKLAYSSLIEKGFFGIKTAED